MQERICRKVADLIDAAVTKALEKAVKKAVAWEFDDLADEIRALKP